MKDMEMKFWTTRPNFMLVATYQHKVVGLLGVQKYERKTAEFNRFSVASKTRGLGIGKTLLNAAIKESKNLGYSMIILHAADVRKNAIRLYENSGFVQTNQLAAQIKMLVPIPFVFHGISRNEYMYTIK